MHSSQGGGSYLKALRSFNECVLLQYPHQLAEYYYALNYSIDAVGGESSTTTKNRSNAMYSILLPGKVLHLSALNGVH